MARSCRKISVDLLVRKNRLVEQRDDIVLLPSERLHDFC